MARKRITESELAVSKAAGAAPVRRKSPVARKHTTPASGAPAASVVEPIAEAVTVETAPAAAAYQPTREDIAALAYSYWAARGYQDGSSEQDWLRAERELSQAAKAANA